MMEIVGNALADYGDEELEEMLGYTEILGEDDDDDWDDDDDDELLGAEDLVGLRMPWSRKRRKRRGRKRGGKLARARRAIKVAVAQKAVKQAQLVQTREPTRSREYPLGFDTVSTVAAGATVDVITRPQVIFRIDRFVVPASIAASFLIVDIKVGKNSQFVASAAVPAETFSNNSFGVRLKGDTAQISQDVLLRVTNISGSALRFFAAIIGPALE